LTDPSSRGCIDQQPEGSSVVHFVLERYIVTYQPPFSSVHSSALDSMGKRIEVTKYTEKLVPSTRFVAVDGVAPKVSEYAAFVSPSASVVGDVTIGKDSR